MKKDNSILLSQAVSEYFKILTSITSRSIALRSIADKATADFGDFITPSNFKTTDEILINLIELIDQIVYEFKDNSEHSSNIRDYIIDDLYSKLSLTLEALNDIDKYLANLKNRSLFPDDLIIIKNRNLSTLIPYLVSESKGLTNLQNEIIKTLLYFNDESILEYYYDSFKYPSSGFIKSAALLGLKYNSDRKMNWTTVTDTGSESSQLIQFARKFNLQKIELNSLPSTKEELTFTLLHIEKNLQEMKNIDAINWIMTVLVSIPLFNFENSWLYEINLSTSSILLNMDLDIFKTILKEEPMMVKVMQFIDFIPGNFFNRLTGKFDDLGLEFLFNLNAAVEKKKILISSSNSNIMNYLCWNLTETF